MKRKQLIIALVLGIMTFVIYRLSYVGDVVHLNYFVPLADAFLQGRLYLNSNPPWLNELIAFNGHYFVVYPPMPAIMLMPFVVLFGNGFAQPLFSILIGSLNVSLCYLVILRVFKKPHIALISAILFGFGTMHWFHAQAGSAWYIAHIIAIFFIWLSLLELFGKKRYWLIGLLIGAAYWSRLPAILAVIFPLCYFFEDFFTYKKKLSLNIKNLFLLGAGIGLFIGFNALYNYARFGVFYDISYQLLPVFGEPWYKNGLFSVVNIPIHLTEIFTALPQISTEFPYIIPSLHVLALWVITPAFLLLPFGNWKKRLVQSLFVTIILMSLPGLAHGSNGFSQFGYRFALDYHPFLILLVMAVMERSLLLKKIGFILIGLSVLVNIWGIVFINFYKIWTM